MEMKKKRVRIFVSFVLMCALTCWKQFMQHESMIVVLCSESSALMGRNSAGLSVVAILCVDVEWFLNWF